ncbi:MAG: hypothetical protein K6G28_02160, partial [Acholeplasmatales bacterium]|nr:hypothetical protein [Acholeplasmatales bacterium]
MEKFEEKIKREYSEKHFFNALFDKYKEPLYIYNSFSRTNSYELTPETSYLYVYSDVLERYYRMKGLNVLYQTGINNLSYSSFSFSKQNALDYKDTLKFKSSLSNLHIGFDSNYFLTLSDAKVLLE